MKFSSALDEAVYTIANHGFADTMGDVQEDGKWEAIADVSPVLLHNLGEHELAERVREELAPIDRQVVVRIAEDTQGNVTRTGYATCGTPGEQTIWSQWDLDNMPEDTEE